MANALQWENKEAESSTPTDRLTEGILACPPTSVTWFQHLQSGGKDGTTSSSFCEDCNETTEVQHCA